MTAIPQRLGIIAGNGAYPRLVAAAARVAGVRDVVAAAFQNETEQTLAAQVDAIEWLRVGQLNRMIQFFRDHDVRHAIMAGQIAPKNLFNLRPDFKALFLLARLKVRNAETLFSAVADELLKNGIDLLPATSFLEEQLASVGVIAGPPLTKREHEDVNFGWRIAREIARLDIGQTIIVRHGTVLAVEAFEGTNETIVRGGQLGRKGAVMVKVAKQNQDMRFDVPCIGPETIKVAAEARIRVVAVEVGRTLLLEKEHLTKLATEMRITVFGVNA